MVLRFTRERHRDLRYSRAAPDGSIAAPADHPFVLTLLFEEAGVTRSRVIC